MRRIRMPAPAHADHLDLGSFSYGGEVHAASLNELAPMHLSWRGDPEELFTDWTVVVRELGGENGNGTNRCEPTVYHIHRHIVGAGPRGSQYFLQLFKSTGLQESENKTSNIDLEPSAAQAFPIMLDFMYALGTVDVTITSENAVALRHLANYFGIPTLFERANCFIRKDLRTSNLHTYLSEAQRYNDDKIIIATVELAVESWYDFLVMEDGRSSSYMQLLSTTQQLKVMELALVEARKNSREHSRLIRKRGSRDKVEACISCNEEEYKSSQLAKFRNYPRRIFRDHI